MVDDDLAKPFADAARRRVLLDCVARGSRREVGRVDDPADELGPRREQVAVAGRDEHPSLVDVHQPGRRDIGHVLVGDIEDTLHPKGAVDVDRDDLQRDIGEPAIGETTSTRRCARLPTGSPGATGR